MKNYAIILAAGKGTRMKTALPKCAYPLLKKPMIEYILESVEKSKIENKIVVVGHEKEVFEEMLSKRVTFAYQHQQLGTAHAVFMAKQVIDDEDGNCIIIPGDMPLITHELIEYFLSYHYDRKNDMTIATSNIENPYGYGRIIRNEYGSVEKIVEENECDKYEAEIKEVNSGMYCIKTKVLFQYIEKIDNKNNKGEYYFTDLVKLIKDDFKVGAYKVKNSELLRGVNDLYSLSLAESTLRMEINKRFLLLGVNIVNPSTVTISDEVILEEGVVIYPNTYITGNSIIRKDAVIGPNTEIHNSLIGERSICKHSLVHDSSVGSDTSVGPFSHLRNHAIIGDKNRIGNFVEIKNTITGDLTKASHLAYLGDAEVGKNVNFGCGSVTVNYDGRLKHKTVIGDNVFIGCNANLIAPIEVGNNVVIGAGSTVYENIPSDALAIARSKQVNKEGYVVTKKEKEELK